MPGVRVLAAGILLVLAVLAAATTLVPPLRVDCPSGGLSEAACRETIAGALRRGLPAPHPLILAARVEPGPAGPATYGHRATVTFGLLEPPARTEVRLYYDRGGHWGGETGRSAIELAAWWALPVGLLVAAALVTLASRDRPRRATAAPDHPDPAVP
jgi:hypothetical protein